jgi:small subunit ribosomal protein YMR-31
MAPAEVAKDFQSFLAKLQSTSTSPSNPSSNPKTQTPKDSAQGKVDRTTESSAAKEDVWKGKPAPPVDFENFWEAPESLWKPKEWSEREIEAVMVSSSFGCRRVIACWSALEQLHRRRCSRLTVLLAR